MNAADSTGVAVIAIFVDVNMLLALFVAYLLAIPAVKQWLTLKGYMLDSTIKSAPIPLILSLFSNEA